MGNACTWRERRADETDEARAEAFRTAGLPPILARLLASRGVTEEGREAFLDPSLTRLARSDDLPGMTEAVQVILPFLHTKRKIVVFGDYDADGVCASAILVTALRRLGGNAEAFIPHRFGEGYGMTAASLERLWCEHADAALVVTVDNGISSPDEVAKLKVKGIQVVVTDHHLPGENLPKADALVNPRVQSCPGSADLCGAGVAFFLASALAQAATEKGLYTGPKFGGPLLVLAGLATVADLVPLKEQNRILVAQSLAYFNRCAPCGLRELRDKAARSAAALTARDYGFLLAPRINAAGRMKTADVAFDLLVCTDEDRERARQLASRIDGFNGERRGFEQTMYQEACAQIDKAGEEDLQAVVAWDAGCVTGATKGQRWHLGVAGIVASRLLEHYHVPAAVAVGETGSVRAPDGYNVHDALAAASEHLVRFGGHAAAGGFTVKPGAFEAFRAAFTTACAKQRKEHALDADARDFDGWVEPGDLTPGLYADLRRLEPFGEGNPEPVFGLRGVTLREVRVMGVEGRHLSLAFVNRDVPRAIWWGHGGRAEDLRKHAARPYDVFFTLTTSGFDSALPHLELRVVDLRPTSFS
ncbi:MAG: single-stranded-DNA-specific exonuclease RecJ [bacterium]|nr:single-stranded-DNA-specific exonuclease RecJ [bacterium]